MAASTAPASAAPDGAKPVESADKPAAVPPAAMPPASSTPPVLPDDREASFMPSPAGLGEKPLTKDEAKIETAPLTAPAAIVVAKEPVLTPDPLPAKVDQMPLPPVDADSFGLLDSQKGGLGATLWEGTPRALVERLLPEIGVPTVSPVLNTLARRLLLTSAAAPKGAGDEKKNFMSLRLEKLVGLGLTAEAWEMANRSGLEKLDDVTLRLVVEGALSGVSGKDVCERIPSLMAARKTDETTGVEWQKALVVCKFLSKDVAAAQTGLDVLREQKAKEDLFLSLANRNVIAGSKQLPHQLTPLKPLTLSLLRLSDVPLPPDLFTRPDTSLIPDLLKSKTSREDARLALAERAAAKGLLSAAQLAEVYKSASFPPEELAKPEMTSNVGPLARALFYQASLQEGAAKRTDLARRIAESVDRASLGGSLGALLAEILAGIAPTAEQADLAPVAARVLTMAGRPEQALGWIKIARAAQKPEITDKLKADWPIFVLSGLVSDQEFGASLKGWLDTALADSDRETPRALRQKAGQILLLVSAAGYAVPEDEMMRVLDMPSDVRKLPTFSPLLVERLRQAGIGNRRGEAILLSLLLAGGNVSDSSLSIWVEAIRALRLVGLPGDAQALARETVIALSGS